MTKFVALLAACFSAASVHAWAAGPVLSGQYILNFSYTCPQQMLLQYDSMYNYDLQNLFTVYPGGSSTVIGVAAFDQSQSPAVVSFNGIATGTGGLVVLQGNGSNPLTPYKSPISVTNGSFSSSANSIELPFLGVSDPVFDAFYVTHGKEGVVRSVAFSNLSPDGGGQFCTTSGTLTR